MLICDSLPRIRCPKGLKLLEDDIVFPCLSIQLAGGQAKWRSESQGISSKGLGSGFVAAKVAMTEFDIGLTACSARVSK